MRKQGFRRDADARRDDPAQVFALGGDGVEGDGGAKIHHDARPAIFFKRGHRVDNPVGAHFLRIVVKDRDAGADSRLDEEGLEAEVTARHLRQHAIERWNH